MCTGVSPKRIATRIVFTSWIHWKLLRNFCCIQGYWHNCYQVSLITQQWNNLYLISLERRWSSRTFRYGYLVTTSPQLSILPSAAPSLRLGHWLRALPTPMVWRAVCTRPGNVFTATFWFAITSDSSFVKSSCRLQSELWTGVLVSLHLAASPPSDPSIVARV